MRGLALLALSLVAACDAAPSGLSPTSAAYVATAVGRIDSANESRRLVAAVDGVIARIPIRRGDHVAADQTLARIDCAPRDADVRVAAAAASEAAANARRVQEGARPEEIAAARAEVDAAAAEARDGRQQRELADALVVRGFLARREADARRNQSDEADARLALAHARLALLEDGPRRTEVSAAQAGARAALDRLSRARALRDQCVIRSPIDGVVLSVLKREGEASGASDSAPVVIVGDLAHLIVRAEVNERDAERVYPGQRVDLWTDGAAHWRGRVTRVAGIMGRRTARSLDPSDRFDRDVLEAFIKIDGASPPALVGLRVTVGFRR
jgi:multidrug resistance efflux pump